VPGEVGTPLLHVRSVGGVNQVLDEHGGVVLDAPGAGYVMNARAFADGRTAMAVTGKTSTTLYVRSPDGHVASAPLGLDDTMNVRAAGPFIAWPRFDPRSPQAPPELFAHSMVDAEAPPVHVGRGPMRGAFDTITCAAAATFLDFAPTVAAHAADGTWHLFEPQWSPAPTASCAGEQLTLVGVSGDAVTRQDCTPQDGCKAASVPVSFPASHAAVGTARDVVVLWDDAVSGAVYFVRAPLAELPRAPVRLLLDSRRPTVNARFDVLLAFGEDVLALVYAPLFAGMYAVVLHADGSVVALPVAGETKR
jgi:hypothetical protein